MFASLPYIPAPNVTFVENLPLLGTIRANFFTPFVVAGVIAGALMCLRYALYKKLQFRLFAFYLTVMTLSAFAFAHWVSVIFYFPHQIENNPWVLLKFWSGLSSTGGFFGAVLGGVVFLKIKRQPVAVYADATLFGLLLGWCFGRFGCTLVHDHPGKVVDAGTFLALGPWPDGSWRYDLGFLELLFTIALTVAIYGFSKWRQRPSGWLVGVVVTSYSCFRFGLDFLRAETTAQSVISTPDPRYFGLTPAQWLTLLFLVIGVYYLRRVLGREGV